MYLYNSEALDYGVIVDVSKKLASKRDDFKNKNKIALQTIAEQEKKVSMKV